MSYKRAKIVKALKGYGFEFTREGHNHTIFTNGKTNIPVGRHREISPKTTQRIAKEIGVPWQEFKRKIS